ncbi:MAG TPA: hypothetical protein VF772_02195, partial [Terriglobales bacterium]
MLSKKSSLAVTAVVTALLVFAVSGFATVTSYNSGPAVPTARFVTNGFAPSAIYAQNPDFQRVITSQNDTITFGNYATAYD